MVVITTFGDLEVDMNINHYSIELLLREKRREVREQARIAHIVNDNKKSQLTTIKLATIYNRLKGLLLPGSIQTQLEEQVICPDLASDCQVC
jgi:hypothetical protein